MVLVDSRTHLEATELAAETTSNGSAADPSDGHAIDALGHLRFVKVHDDPLSNSIHFHVVGQVSRRGEEGERPGGGYSIAMQSVFN